MSEKKDYVFWGKYYKGDGKNRTYNLDWLPLPDYPSSVTTPNGFIREYTITQKPAQIVFKEGNQPGKDVLFKVVYSIDPRSMSKENTG